MSKQPTESGKPTDRDRRRRPAAAATAASTAAEFCCCGPGRKRYLIALLCSLGLTVVIGMRAEMVAIMDYLNRRSDANTSAVDLSAAAQMTKSSATGGGGTGTVGVGGVGGHAGSAGGSSGSSGAMFQLSSHRQMPWQNTANDLIENSLFIGYLVASPVGGYLTVHHDSSLLLGCSVALTCGLNLFLPLVTQIAADISASIAVIVVLRLLQVCSVFLAL